MSQSIEQIVRAYFDAIHAGGWEAFIADDMTFVNNNLDDVAFGKDAYLLGAGQFFRVTTSVKVQELLVQGDHAAILARYDIRTPATRQGVCDVAEFLIVTEGKISANAIFFDTQAFTALLGG